jgi:hypothetical protein
MLLPSGLLFAIAWGATSGPAVTKLRCNASALAPGSVTTLTEKLDQSGKFSGTANHWPCAIAGPATGAPATIVLPKGDCALHAGGDITLAGRIVFVAGQAKDCCGDGEGHGSIMCTDSGGNITIEAGAVITVQARSNDPEASVGPGGFHADGGLTVHGTVNASLLPGQRLTGRNGLLAGNGGSTAGGARSGVWVRRGGAPYSPPPPPPSPSRVLHVAAGGVVIVRGGASAFGSALAGGGDGVRVDGVVECYDYHGGNDGGCISAGNAFVLGRSGVVRAINGSTADAGGVISAQTMLFEGGLVYAESITVKSAGGVLTANCVNLSGNATIIARNVHADASGSVVATGNLTLRGGARIEDHWGWGGDGGAVACQRAELHDHSS